MPALTFRASANFALAKFLAFRSFGNVSVRCRRFAPGRLNETYQVPRDLLAMRPSRGLALQLLSLWTSESMGNHDSNVMGGADSVD